MNQVSKSADGNFSRASGKLPPIAELLVTARNDTRALDELFGWYRLYLRYRMRSEQRIHRFLSKLDGSDIVQTVMLKACRDFANFRGLTEKELSSWFHAIVNNTVLDAERRYFGTDRDVNRERPFYANDESASLFFQMPAADDSGPVSRLIRGEAALQLAAAIESLPADQATAITLRHQHGMSVKQIAIEMGKSTSAVAGLLKRGTATLRRRLPHLLRNDEETTNEHE